MRKGSGGSRRARVPGSVPGSGPGPPPPLPGGAAALLWARSRRRCPRLVPPLLALAAAAAVLYGVWPGEQRHSQRPPRSAPSLRHLLSRLDPPRLWGTFLRPLLHERVPGGPGSRAARQHILRSLGALGASWHLELDPFVAATPRGPLTFTNVVATLAPAAPRRLALACHYDTKVLPEMSPEVAQVPPGGGHTRHGEFVGATDSAVPCALLLELAAALDGPLRQSKDKARVTLQLLFLDGEEAFGAWSAADSLYGARHLARRMAGTAHGDGTQLSAISLLVLLDLLGAPSPAIHSHFPQSHHWFLRLVAIERRLRELGLLELPPLAQPLFRLEPPPGAVEDDHVPFLRRGYMSVSPDCPQGSRCCT
ncbi:glutaminyl-peptide cyclotransferase-like protein isoform X2 [Patagioenas fasciata]|uniref:glutaminyl-peptide cyclotransferase-like protein isoform X2 n=1 Tax=Patagioenas fasciata TaxID=372321 RepID=UPI003A999115